MRRILIFHVPLALIFLIKVAQDDEFSVPCRSDHVGLDAVVGNQIDEFPSRPHTGQTGFAPRLAIAKSLCMFDVFECQQSIDDAYRLLADEQLVVSALLAQIVVAVAGKCDITCGIAEPANIEIFNNTSSMWSFVSFWWPGISIATNSSNILLTAARTSKKSETRCTSSRPELSSGDVALVTLPTLSVTLTLLSPSGPPGLVKQAPDILHRLLTP